MGITKINKMKNDLAIIIPCYNCENTILEIIRDCLSYTAYVIAVDDGSLDNTQLKIEQSGAILKTLKKNMGVGFATITGIEVAREYGCNTYLTIDSDGAHNPSNIPSIINFHKKNNCDLTIGDRWSSINNSIYYPSSKIWSNRFATSLVNTILDSHFYDVSCGFRVISEHAYRKINKNKAFGYDFIYQSIFDLYDSGIIKNCKIDCLYNAECLFFTRKSELIGLIKSALIYKDTKNETKTSLRNMLGLINRNQIIRINIAKNKIVAIPIPEFEGYIFQYQNPVFNKISPDLII